MFSVTSRIKNVVQPRGGYINLNIFKTVTFADSKHIKSVPSSLKSMQGCVVDYLVRYKSGFEKEDAFRIPLLAAEKLSEDELIYAQSLLQGIKPELDNSSILRACELANYDVVLRRGKIYFSPFRNVKPFISYAFFDNIRTLVGRSLKFFAQYGKIVRIGMTFGKGYNKIISSGDCDYLTNDALRDLKVTPKKPDKNDTLQVAVYYIMGLHSMHREFRRVRFIGIFNPLQNVAYYTSISAIDESTYSTICREVIGYITPTDPFKWRDSYGTDEEKLNKILNPIAKQETKDIDQKISICSDFSDFDPSYYEDGIYDITVDDYWNYYCSVKHDYTLGGNYARPKFPFVDFIKCLKHGGFYMFIAVRGERISILNGAKIKRLDKPVEYYYSRLPAYGQTVLHYFSPYWNAQLKLSEEVKKIKATKRLALSTRTEWPNYEYGNEFSGVIHGCIIDLDTYNHLFLNPFDGSITPYYALAMDSKIVYDDFASLISEHRPEMLPGFKKYIQSNKNTSLLGQSVDMRRYLPDSMRDSMKNDIGNANFDEIDEIPHNNASYVEDTSMYKISRTFKSLQSVFEYGIVSVWFDSLLSDYRLN